MSSSQHASLPPDHDNDDQDILLNQDHQDPILPSDTISSTSSPHHHNTANSFSNFPQTSASSKSLQLVLYLLTSSYVVFGICVLIFLLSILYLATVIFFSAHWRDSMPENVYERAQYIARFQVPLFDGHNDLPNRIDRLERKLGRVVDLTQRMNDTQRSLYISVGEDLHTDIPRMREGELRGQFWSIFASCYSNAPVQEALRQFDSALQLVERYSQDMVFVSNSNDIWNLYNGGNRVLSLMGVEGGHMLGKGNEERIIKVLHTFYRLGARYMTLTHSCDTSWAKNHASTNSSKPGLTSVGLNVVREMNRLGMMVDLSHTHPDTMRQALAITEAPVIFSHSSAYEVCHHTRNVPDDVIDLIAKNGGVIMINYYTIYISEVSRLEYEKIAKEHSDMHYSEYPKLFRQWEEKHPNQRATIETVCDHIDYIRARTGSTKNIGIGGDFDGVTLLPKGLQDVSKHYRIGGELLKRGYKDQEIRDIFGENIVRVMSKVEETASRLRSEGKGAISKQVDSPFLINHGMQELKEEL